ncbi:MAG: glycosyltransferase family 39 protein [Prevotella sp.]|jgi:hypothetical protein|nr:glycosyltransferase family 39 protein [Prevotella sp.]
MAIICFLTIPIISVLISRNITKKSLQDKTVIIEYGIDCALLILMVNIVMHLLKKQKFIERFNTYPEFAIKFIVLLVTIALVWGFLKSCILTNRCRIKLDNSQSPINNKTILVIYYILVVVIALLNLIRVTNMTYWGDEAFSIRLAKMTAPDLIEATASDVHPPLYYLFLRIAFILLGDHGYTYHLVSLIPVLLMIVFAVTVVKKKYGITVSILFLAIENFMGVCFRYNLEIRNYSWANLFVFLCFWYGIELIEKKKGKVNWILFTLSGILAAYTHYYALVSVAFIYLVVYIVLIAGNKGTIWKCVFSGLVCVVSYLPWLRILLSTFSRTSSSWWLTFIPSFNDCIQYIIGTDIFSKSIAILLIVSLIIYLFMFLRDLKPISLKDDALHIDMAVVVNQLKKRESINLLVAAAAIVGTIGFGIGISKLFRPLFYTKYTYQMIGIYGLCIAIFAVKAFISRRVAAIIFSIIFLLGAITWCDAYKEDKDINTTTIESVQYINSLYADGDKVVSNVVHLNWTVLDAYFDFPHADYVGYTADYEGKTTWMLYAGKLDDEFETEIESHSGSIVFVKKGQISVYEFNIYKISFDIEDE